MDDTRQAIRERLGTFGLWTMASQWAGDADATAEAAAEVEELGFGSVWIGLSTGDLELQGSILAATDHLVTASGILSVWTEPPPMTAHSYHRLEAEHPGRLLLGLGASHSVLVEAMTDQAYRRPLSKVATYLDELAATDPPVPADRCVLAALGPKALALAGERTAGAHPYLTTPEHTADARQAMGRSPLLVPEHKVVLSEDAEQARAAARSLLASYLELPNYLNNLRRYGFDDEDFSRGGSDRLVDALVAWGDDDTVVGKLRAHLEAGADHVVVQVIPTEANTGIPRSEWRNLAGLLLG
jgi:probable F420-dependent oxidoreductase